MIAELPIDNKNIGGTSNIPHNHNNTNHDGSPTGVGEPHEKATPPNHRPYACPI